MDQDKDSIILGISAYYHDSAAAIMINGKIIAAAQEERFTRVKHDPRFPENAINYCLEEAFLETEDVDKIVFYDNPLLTYERVINNAVFTGEASEQVFTKASKSILGNKLWIEDDLIRTIGGLGKYGQVIFAGHHITHAASAFFPSPYEEAAILTIDGVGEWNTTTISHGKGNDIKVIKSINYPHSLGLLYSAFTQYCGFKVNSGEYKLMGLAPYGKPIYQDIIRKELISVKSDGSFNLNLDYFGFLTEDSTINEKFESLFGGPSRVSESQITRKEMDLAASVQHVTEEIVNKLATYALEVTGSSNLCMAGGVALNCVANGRLIAKDIVQNLFIQPASGDAGGALGSCYVGHYLMNKNPRTVNPADDQSGSYLGPTYSDSEIRAFLDRNECRYQFYENKDNYFDDVAEYLKDGKIIGLFNGRMEFGPRALGARSIIGDARSPSMQSKMNLKIKYRESFRPFAPAVLEEDLHTYFDIKTDSPYMLLVAPVHDDIRIETDNAESNSDDMISVINQSRSSLPAVTHVDYSARIQTVKHATNPRFYNLLQAFKAKTGTGVLVNTSFNVRGEPIVCSPKDAYQCFMRTEIDVLVLNDFVLLKEEQPNFEDDTNWQDEYELD